MAYVLYESKNKEETHSCSCQKVYDSQFMIHKYCKKDYFSSIAKRNTS